MTHQKWRRRGGQAALGFVVACSAGGAAPASTAPASTGRAPLVAQLETRGHDDTNEPPAPAPGAAPVPASADTTGLDMHDDWAAIKNGLEYSSTSGRTLGEALQ